MQDTTSSAQAQHQHQDSQHNAPPHQQEHLLGIALVVEELGRRAKLVFRYPLAAATNPSSSSPSPSSSSIIDPTNSNAKHHGLSGGGGGGGGFSSHSSAVATPSTTTIGSVSKATTSNSTANSNNVVNPSSSSVSNPSSSSSNVPNSSTSSSSSSSKMSTTASTTSSTTKIENNLFFTMSSRTMAKLFRTKTPLCGQPMTLTIGGTIFCCRSVLLNQHHSSTSSSSGGGGAGSVVAGSASGIGKDDISVNSTFSRRAATTATTTTMSGGGLSSNSPSSSSTEDNLVLFNVIVAFLPLESTTSIPRAMKKTTNRRSSSSSTSSIGEQQQQQKQRSSQKKDTFSDCDMKGGATTTTTTTTKKKKNKNSNNHNKQNNENDDDLTTTETIFSNNSSSTTQKHPNSSCPVDRMSTSFPAVRRIHLTLSRLCQVLEREEKRCLYVSRYVSNLLQIRGEYEKGLLMESGISSTSSSNRPPSPGSSGSTGKNSDTGGSGMCVDGGKHCFEEGGTNNKSSVDSSSPLVKNVVDCGTGGGGASSQHLTPSGGEGGAGMSSNTSTINQSISAAEKLLRNEEKQQAILELMLAASPPAPWQHQQQDQTANSEEEDEYIRQRYRRGRIRIFGNLARELVQTYHALARNETEAYPSPASILNGRDAIVYVNSHIAIHVEPASPRIAHMIGSYDLHMSTSSSCNTPSRSIPSPISANNSIPFLRYYHTLLFPYASASELLQGIQSSTTPHNGNYQNHGISRDSSQQIIEKLLVVAHPFKSLGEMARITAIPLPLLLEVASSLVESGACIAIPVMSESTKFACQHGAVQRMASLTLPFAQEFGPMIPGLIVLSALTTPMEDDHNNSSSNGHPPWGKSQGENLPSSSPATVRDVLLWCEAACKDSLSETIESPKSNEVNEDEEFTSDNIPSRFQILKDRISDTLRSANIPKGFMIPSEDLHAFSGGLFEEQERDLKTILIAMIVWLRAHSIIVEYKEYLTPIGARQETRMKKGENSYPYQSMEIEKLYKELVSEDILTGDVSTLALAWRLCDKEKEGQVSENKLQELRDKLQELRHWGIKEKKLQVVNRIPEEGDDWGAP